MLVVKGDDVDCNGMSNSNRTKKVTLVINSTISKRDYAIATGSAVAIAILFCISYITTVVIYNIKKNRNVEKLENINNETEGISEQVPSPSTTEVVINAVETKCAYSGFCMNVYNVGTF